MRLPKGITRRIALLGWMVTLLTLGILVMAVVPLQKCGFEMGMESKARGAAVSIRGAAAGAALSQGDSAVLAQAMQGLSGGRAIACGLSLEGYNQTVRPTCQGTDALTVLCAGLGLSIALLYAARLATPIHLRTRRGERERHRMSSQRASPKAGTARRWRFAPLQVMTIGGLAIGTALAQQAPTGSAASAGIPRVPHSQLREIASRRVFRGVSLNDARAALKVWFDDLGRKGGYALDTAVDIVDSASEIRDRLRSRSVELVAMGVLDYLELESSNLVIPALTDARTSQGALYSYVLLVSPSSGAASIAGLKGKNILVSARGSGETGMALLDILLGREKLGRAASFFASIQTPDKPQACILPLFFGKTDACVVDEVNLNLAKEMNPQLGQLRVIARSRPMIESVIGVPAEPHPRQQELVDSMLSLHQDPRGRQLLLVFKTERIVRIQPGDLESTREFWSEYYRLTGSLPNRPAGSGHWPAAGSSRGGERP